MHERHKLDEASYFIERMRAEHDNRTAFRFELSAFLGASRSVLQYALREASTKPEGRKWYDQALTRDPIFAFFKELRDDNIHTQPARPAAAFTTAESDYLEIDEETIIPYRHTTTSIRHTFADWKGNESVLELVDRYLSALRILVDEGIAKKMISG